ncbi:MAG TPA: DUF4345 family protein [Longilinea sp.]|nr:DUF4345 family protein [Longilinea sp.]
MILSILKIIAAIATALTGLLALLKPTSVRGFTGLFPENPRGITEVRAIFGGLFIALGVVPILLNVPAAYQMLGYGYLGIAFVRLISIFFDKSSVSSNWISLAIEIVLGIILVI